MQHATLQHSPHRLHVMVCNKATCSIKIHRARCRIPHVATIYNVQRARSLMQWYPASTAMVSIPYGMVSCTPLVGASVDVSLAVSTCKSAVHAVRPILFGVLFSSVFRLGLLLGIKVGCQCRGPWQVALQTVRSWLEESDNVDKIDKIIFCTFLSVAPVETLTALSGSAGAWKSIIPAQGGTKGTGGLEYPTETGVAGGRAGGQAGGNSLSPVGLRLVA